VTAAWKRGRSVCAFLARWVKQSFDKHWEVGGLKKCHSQKRHGSDMIGQMKSVNETLNPLTKTLIREIQTAPEAVQREVFDFLVFLKTRQAAPAEGGENLLPLAQSAWAADWQTPEEDEAWRDL
jgi:hypothetical protein